MQAWAGFAGVGAVIWAAKVGKNTFGSWLVERQTERRLDIADKLMTLVYRAQRAFPEIRSATSIWAEDATAEQRLQESHPQYSNWEQHKKDRYRGAQIVLDRLKAKKDLWSNIYESLPLARAYYGQQCEERLQQILRLQSTVLHRANTYARTSDTQNQEISDKAFDALFSEDDDIDSQLRELVMYFEQTVLPDLVASGGNMAR